MKAQLNQEIESPVYSVTSVEDDKKLYELSVRMKQLATEIKDYHVPERDRNIIPNVPDELADTVLEFLKVAGWSR